MSFPDGSDPAIRAAAAAIQAGRRAVTRAEIKGQIAKGNLRAETLLHVMTTSARRLGQTPHLRVKAEGVSFPVILGVDYLKSLVRDTLEVETPFVQLRGLRRAGHSDELLRLYVNTARSTYAERIGNDRFSDDDHSLFWKAVDQSLSSHRADLLLVDRDGVASECRLVDVASIGATRPSGPELDLF